VEVTEEKWRICVGHKHFMCSNLGKFLINYSGSEDWVAPKEFIGVSPPELMAKTWLGMKKGQTVEFIDGNKFHYALENLRVVDIPRKLTIGMKFIKDQITKEMVEQVLQYKPESGLFLIRKGKAGGIRWVPHGEFGTYYMVPLFGNSYRAQDLAVLVMTGVWPVELKTKNSNWGDARWENVLV
jgi:hypothetical protein